MAERKEAPTHVGLVCKSLQCLCPPGTGHKHPDWIAWEKAEREWDEDFYSRENEDECDDCYDIAHDELTDREKCDDHA